MLPAKFAYGSAVPTTNAVVDIAGPYWRDFCSDKQGLSAIAGTWVHASRQLARRLQEIAEAEDPNLISWGKTEEFTPILVPVKEVKASSIAAKYDWLDDQPQTTDRYVLPLPKHVQSIAGLADKIVRPDVYLTNELEFQVGGEPVQIETYVDPVSYTHLTLPTILRV